METRISDKPCNIGVFSQQNTQFPELDKVHDHKIWTFADNNCHSIILKMGTDTHWNGYYYNFRMLGGWLEKVERVQHATPIPNRVIESAVVWIRVQHLGV